MCTAIIAYKTYIFVTNQNILNRRAPAVKYNNTASSGLGGGGVMASTQSTITSANADQEIQNSDYSHSIDLMTPIIFRVCLVMYNLLTPHAHVRLSNITQLKQQLCTDQCLSRGTESNQQI